MPSTANALQKTAPTRAVMLQVFLAAIDAFHRDEAKIQAGIDPDTGAPLAAEGQAAAMSAATMRLTVAMHASIDAAWAKSAQDALTSMWGRADPTPQAARVLESETARQKAFASRFALDVARGETGEGRKIPEPTRAAMYSDAAQAGYQVSAALNVPDGYLIWWILSPLAKSCFLCPIHAASSPYTRETLPSFPRDGATPCRARCKCHLEFRLAAGVSSPRTEEEKQQGRRFEERIVNPPPLPPGKRLPTPEERGVMRDREIQLNFARRKAADADAAGRRDEATLWYRRRKELNAEAIAYAKERGIHDVPTFSVGEVINGNDVGQRDIDRLTHFRGIDGVTVSRAQVAAIKEATARAKADVLAVLKDYPAADPVGRAEWRRLLKENGAPASAFGGELTRLATEAHDHDHDAPLKVRGRPVLGILAAVEANVPEVTDEVLAIPADVMVVNLVSETVRETLENHAAALAVLGAAGRRTGVAPYRVEVGPFGEGWGDAVAAAGTWVQGDRAEVVRFLEALRASAPAGFAVATWQPMG